MASCDDDVLQIEIVNWEKYNPKKNNKQQLWFRADANMAQRMLQQGFTAREIGVWMWLLGVRCGAGSGVIRVSLRVIRGCFRLKQAELGVMMEKLERYQCIKRSVFYENSPTDVTNEQTNRRTNSETENLFNFENREQPKKDPDPSGWSPPPPGFRRRITASLAGQKLPTDGGAAGG